jgi:signal transduction histidine kinase
MKRLLPGSVGGWLILLIVTGLVISQAVALAVHHASRREAQAMLENFRIAERVTGLTRLIDHVTPERRPDLVARLSRSTLIVTWEPASAVDAGEPESPSSALMLDAIRARADELPLRSLRVQHVDAPLIPVGAAVLGPLLGQDPPALRGTLRQLLEQHAMGPAFVISLQLADSTWLNIAAADQQTVAVWSFDSLALVGGLLAIVIGLSVWGTRRLTAPLRTLAGAAERLGVDVNAAPLAERGPDDLRHAIRAFNDMQARIRRFVEDRTRMIAAISHDLRTPITRLRLRAELIDDAEQQRKMIADLDDMETMIGATLAFAREEANPEPREALDLAAMLRDICESLPGAAVADPRGDASVPFVGQRVALRRGFTNVIANACKYAGGAQVSLAASGNAIVVAVDDEGPGLPEEELERVFRPFYRLEQSRSRDTGGVGLGLTVARTVFRGHGGDMTLANRPEGGLRVTIRLPVSK